MSVDAAVVKNENKYIPTIDPRDYFDACSEETERRSSSKCGQDVWNMDSFEGHAVPVESQRRMFAACKALFDPPLEKKRRISLFVATRL